MLKAIKESKTLRQIPVVILTTSDAERDIAQGYQYHANSYLIKPVGFEEFTKLVESLGFYWLLWNKYPYG